MRDAGARVLKIEPPSGDPLRRLSSEWYARVHEGVAVETVDLTTDAGRRALAAHLARADLCLTSQRPSRLARLGLSLEALREAHPHLRVLRIVGSLGDPERPGHDLTYQAEAGLLGDDMPRSLFADVLAAERAFAGMLLLLRGQAGATLDVGMVESLEPLAAPLRLGLTAPNGALGGGAPQYRVYRAKTGRVAVAALEVQFEARLWQELDVPPRSDPSERFLERSAREWQAWAVARDLPIVAVNDSDEGRDS
jgi:crotonobetainyl-CoA:carnitine CoA-transferase CaiB-like acyl-CoA transferase